jgi:hypothetical protein
MNSKQLNQRIMLIPDGFPLILENMTVRVERTGKLLVFGWTQTHYLENISKDKILTELDNLKNDFSILLQQFAELRSLIELNNLKVEFHIDWNEGKNGIGICSEIDGIINWYL